eukprot:m.132048 g.132048  ORF g.132048 m.132048 type:complete len:649 (+) comp52374_c0_seq2:1442-3388(+)
MGPCGHAGMWSSESHSSMSTSTPCLRAAACIFPPTAQHTRRNHSTLVNANLLAADQSAILSEIRSLKRTLYVWQLMETGVIHVAEDPVLLIGLDFGTTFSGFSFTKFNKEVTNAVDINITQATYSNHEWEDQGQFPQYAKTPTVLFYLPEGGRPLWGWPAWKASMAKRQGSFYKWFKLYLSEEILPSSRAPLPPGRSPVELCADYLRALGEEALRKAKDKLNLTDITFHHVKWCITVPAMWDQHARAQTRQAAELAGLLDRHGNGGSPHELVFALEPEAASLYAFVSDKPVRDLQDAPFLLADCGGGTVDLVVHRAAFAKGKLTGVQEITSSVGAECGGITVDMAFWAYLATQVGEDTVTSVREKNFDEYARVSSHWELIKRSFDGDGPQEMDLPRTFRKAYQRLHPVEDDTDQVFVIPFETMKAFFEPSIVQTIDLVRTVLARPELQRFPPCTAILLVGGFSLSHYFHKQVKERLQPLVVIRVPRASEAVMFGASMIAQCPGTFTHHIMRHSFGIAANRKALPDDPKSKLFTLHGEVWTTGWFKEFVKVGQAVPVDQVVSQTFQILGDHNVPFIIYSSSVSKPSQFVDDPEVTKVSEFLVRARDFPGCALSGVEVRMYFGRALIEVEFYDKSTGTRVHRRVLAKLAP